MKRPGRATIQSAWIAILIVLFFASTLGATPPVPEETVTGCVKDGQMSIQAPERFKRERPLKINPCANIPFDIVGTEGKQIRAKGGIDLYNGAFVCPKDVTVLGTCSPAAPGLESVISCNPNWPCDRSPCERVDASAVRVPDDFEVTYVTGPLHANWGGQFVLYLRADGRVTEREGVRPPRPGKAADEKVTEYTVSADSVRQIYAAILACHFFDLDTRYWNQKVMDGGSQYLKVVAGGRTHAVTTYYYIVNRFSRVVSLLDELCKPSRMATLEKKDRPRLLTEEEAEEIVWNLPEIKAIMQRMKGTGANPFAMITGYPDPEAQPGNQAAAYEVYVGENHGTHTVRAMTFIVDAYGGQVSVYDELADRIIPIEQYRKQVRK
jgi:hypothetical protein